LRNKPPLCRLGKTARGGQGAEIFQPFAFQIHYFTSSRQPLGVWIETGSVGAWLARESGRSCSLKVVGRDVFAGKPRSNEDLRHICIMPFVHGPAVNSIGQF
jgi:hypothetical protein